MANNNFNIPKAEWFEEIIRDMADGFDPVAVCFAAIDKDGSTYISYNNCKNMDKLVISGMISQDAMIDTMRIRGMIEDPFDREEGEECDDDDEEEEND